MVEEKKVEISKLIYEIKDNKERFALLVDRFEPLIQKYVRLLYKDEKEDTYAELVAALWEAVYSMEFYDNDGKIVKYLSTALRNKFLELYRTSRKYHDHIAEADETTIYNITSEQDSYNDQITFDDMSIIEKKLCGRKKKIFRLIFYNECSDKEVAMKLGISRQYVHRVKNEICELIKADLLNLKSKK